MDDLVERVAVELIAMRLASYADQARAIISIVLEEAAKVAENEAAQGSYRAGERIAAAIRALGAP